MKEFTMRSRTNILRRLVWVLAFFIPVASFAQDVGKFRGIVKDQESNEPLAGVNVVVVGTTLGATTDINGEYIILGVPLGVYSLRASIVGYAPITISNVRASANLTTTVDFQLVPEAVQVEPIEIVAERPLIQRNTTNTVRMVTQENIVNLPIRGVQNIVALQAGVVQQNGRLFVRGGRVNETAQVVGSTGTGNPITGDQTVTVIQEAIEEMQVQAGGYTAEYGGANSGIIRTTLRAGTPDYHASINFRTDDFAKPGQEFLGTSAFGYRNGVFTLSGPVVDKNLKFFIAGEHDFIRDRDQRWLQLFKFENLRVDENDARFRRDANGNPLPADSQAFLPGPIAFSENYVPNNYRENNTAQGTLTYDFQPYNLRFTGSYSSIRQPDASNWPTALDNIFRSSILRRDKTQNFMGELRFTHVVNPETFYDLTVSRVMSTRRIYDPRFDDVSSPSLPALTVGGASFTPTFLDNWNTYVDSIANANLGYTGFVRRFEGPNQWSTINGFRLNDPNAPNNAYSQTNYNAWTVSANVTSQITSNYELKAGGRLQLGEARVYEIRNISQAMIYLYGIGGQSPRTFTSMQQLEAELARDARGRINHYGYDVFGNEVDDGIDGPREPLFASAYIQNKLEYNDLILNIGVRFEHMDTKAKTFPNPATPDSFFNSTFDVINYDKLVDVDPFDLVLPRISFSFPVTNNTVFYALYGKYAQLPSLNQLYVGNTAISRTVSPVSRGNAFLTPIGFLMKPERTTQYEMGFRQLLTDNLAFTVSGFYKDTKDQLSVRSFTDANGNALYTAYLNQDFGTIKGLELTFELRRVNRLAARLNYTLSDARGTGSNPQSSFGSIEQGFGRATDFINALTFNQTHRGSVLLDYRFAQNDGGPVLEGLGANLLLTFNSGHNYTRIKPPASLGQANAWNVGVYPLLDPRFSIPAEPINASSTPWFFNFDLSLSKVFWVGNLSIEVYANILNVLNTKQVINVYPNTGTPEDDGWLTSPLSVGFVSIPGYVDFYKTINQQNQWAYKTMTGLEMYGTPRQIRFGMKLDI
jgi:outer membrane receptor protein involved in Fe transport